MAGPWVLIWASWLAIIALWIALALGNKPTARAQSNRGRALHSLAAIGALFIATVGPRWMIYAPSRSLQWEGALLTVAGCAMAAAARVQLGRNWSPHASLKAGQELAQTGAYAITRHPIYTGLLGALLGTAATLGEVRGFAAFALLAVSFHFKSRTEEALLKQEFGSAYADYQHRVKRLVPLVW